MPARRLRPGAHSWERHLVDDGGKGGRAGVGRLVDHDLPRRRPEEHQRQLLRRLHDQDGGQLRGTRPTRDATYGDITDAVYAIISPPSGGLFRNVQIEVDIKKP